MCDWTSIPQVTPCAALDAAACSACTIIDVREPDEVTQEALKAAFVACPMSRLNGEVAPAADKAAALRALGIEDDMGMSADKALYCLCRAGRRGQSVAVLLKSCGKTHVANVTGGILACEAGTTACQSSA